MVVMTAVLSIGLVVASSKVLARATPASWVPVAYGLTGVVVVANWALSAEVPALAARALCLLVSGVGPILGSGFWLITSERFDPHTASGTTAETLVDQAFKTQVKAEFETGAGL